MLFPPGFRTTLTRLPIFECYAVSNIFQTQAIVRETTIAVTSPRCLIRLHPSWNGDAKEAFSISETGTPSTRQPQWQLRILLTLKAPCTGRVIFRRNPVLPHGIEFSLCPFDITNALQHFRSKRNDAPEDFAAAFRISLDMVAVQVHAGAGAAVEDLTRLK